ncbi:hypothetical protein LPJ66_008185 [Kickxella alabastrina]|uniref:Uncharacterized protein n=1 Tax=Kickxella alabastrina TaxID=61397 RepID=A0ACC1I708_9FUNG|nr:hypothetical protein LPJ66_008185 [Kickxella alabastrina]
MEAVYPPQGESSSDIVLVPSTAGQRKEMVAQMGLAMLYASLKHRAWPTTHFYSVLISALGHAGMISELRQVFEVIIPAVMRKLPPALRINPAFTPSPIIWTMAIREAAKSGDRVLAEYWFKEYRMSAMPIFREEASAYSRFVYRNQPKYARLFILGRPYYVVPQLRRALLDDGSVPEPWYDLREVEKQLEMDRLRALDKLPLSHLDAVRMMTIYATVDEHRDMESAELLADEIVALYQDSTVPKYSRPRGAADMALCWKLMVSGYLGVLRYQQQQIGYSASSVRKTKERLVYWYSEWSKAFKRANVHPDIPGHIRMALSKQEIGVIETIRRSIS